MLAAPAFDDAAVLEVRMRYLFSGELEIVGVEGFLLESACLSLSVAELGAEELGPYLLPYDELGLDVVVDGLAGAVSRLMLRYVPPE